MADAEQTQEEILTSMHQTVSGGIDRLFQIAFSAYADRVEDDDAIYRMFVGVLAQTLGRHIAGFPAEHREQIQTEALMLQEEMTAIVLEDASQPSLSKEQATADGYDLANITPMGNA